MNNSRILRIKNAKFSGYYFYMKWNIQKEFQVCISVPLMKPLKKNSHGHFLTAVKAFKTQRELHHCLAALKVFNPEKDTITVLKFLIPKKDSITFLRLVKLLTLRKGSITSLRLLKVLILKNEGRLSYHIYD